MRVIITIPDPLAEATDRLAARLGLSRSDLIEFAVTRLLEEFDRDIDTARLDAVYAAHPDAGVDPGLLTLQRAVLPSEEWES